ncbi:membrane transporter, putative [Bodo saltans]|uniref:Membrane transporter, putative n=1 Tax=Bodo saltans TaxID=75058 RepID=A0A0S4JEP9_BODSA|nr:membrane transporter, putative [Bodo saltans]|eukprot:CUG88507.1 membrane transporter, putative [Bodo saltans]
MNDDEEEEHQQQSQAISRLEDVLQSNKEMIKELLVILIPADVSAFLWMSAQSITMMFVGSRLGSDALAQYSVGVMVFNICGISVITGIGSAMDTTVSQAYGRDPLSPEIGEALQRALCLCSALVIPCTVFFEFVLVPLQVPIFGETIGAGSAAFLAWSPIYMVPLLVGASIRRLMLATRAADLVAYANAAAFLTSPVANWLFIDLGVGLGATSALAAISSFNALAYIALCIWHPKMDCVRTAVWPLSPRALEWTEVKTFLALGIPSMIAMCAEWWAFDMQQLFTTYVDSDSVAAFGICMTALVALFSVALGVSISCTTLVGNALGANCPIRARQYVRFLIAAGLILSTAAGIALCVFGDRFVRLFTDNERVRDIAFDTLPIVALCHIGDTIQFSLQGFFRAVGKQGITATAVLVTLWLVGLPASAVLCLVAHLGTKGVFLGLLIGFLFEIPLLAYFMTKWDWTAIALEASVSKSNETNAITTSHDGAVDVVVDDMEEMSEGAALVAITVPSS